MSFCIVKLSNLNFRITSILNYILEFHILCILHNLFCSCTVIFWPLLVLTLNQWHTHLILYPNLSRFPLHVNVTSCYCNTVSIIYTTDYFMLINCSMFSTSNNQSEKIYNFSYLKKHTFQTQLQNWIRASSNICFVVSDKGVSLNWCTFLDIFLQLLI